MSARISNDLRIACTIGLAASLAGACSSSNEERDLPACTGKTYILESAIKYQLIEGFSPPRLTSIEADTVGTMLHTTPTGSLSDGVNVPEGLHQTIALGQSTPLGKDDVFTLIDLLPLSAGKHWSRPVVHVQQDTQLIDTARTHSANDGLALHSNEEDNRN